jgi:hypothetical protein
MVVKNTEEDDGRIYAVARGSAEAAATSRHE